MAEKIKQVMNTAGVEAYRVPRRNIVFGKEMGHTGFWPDYLLRLFRTGKITHPTDIHVQPEVKGSVGVFPAESAYALIHHHYPSISEFVTRSNTYTSFETEKLLAKKERYSPLDALTAFFAQFQTRYFRQEGYKDGSVGLTLSLLLGMYSMLAVLKAWETKKLEASESLVEVEAAVNDGCRQTTYWVANERLKQSRSPIRSLALRFRRKANS
jgi:hypothetical protein